MARDTELWAVKRILHFFSETSSSAGRIGVHGLPPIAAFFAPLPRLHLPVTDADSRAGLLVQGGGTEERRVVLAHAKNSCVDFSKAFLLGRPDDLTKRCISNAANSSCSGRSANRQLLDGRRRCDRPGCLDGPWRSDRPECDETGASNKSDECFNHRQCDNWKRLNRRESDNGQFIAEMPVCMHGLHGRRKRVPLRVLDSRSGPRHSPGSTLRANKTVSVFEMASCNIVFVLLCYIVFSAEVHHLDRHQWCHANCFKFSRICLCQALTGLLRPCSGREF